MTVALLLADSTAACAGDVPSEGESASGSSFVTSAMAGHVLATTTLAGYFGH